MQIKSLLATVSLVMTLATQVTSQVSQVVDANNFCVYLPPPDSVNRNIADTEWNGQAYCMGNTPKAVKANKMPDGFIQSAHLITNDKYIQVTGQIDPTKANLNVSDWGGQFDVAAPKGSSCDGWKFYVNMIEPIGKTYCMRCCNDKVTCNRGISEKGCAHVIPGDYSGPMSVDGSSPSASSSASSSASGPAVSVSISSSSAKSSSSSSGTLPSSSNGSTPNASGNVSAQSVDNKSAGSVTQPATAITLMAIAISLLTQ